jgi:guanine deaminase
MKRIIKSNLLNPLSPQKTDLQKEVYIHVDGNKISKITSRPPVTNYEDKTDTICLPGLIDTHVHLSQYNAKGKHSSGLLEWLNTYIFREEKLSHQEKYARKISEQFFQETFAYGTTTTVIYTAPYSQACNIAFETAKQLGARAMIGKTMMDRNSPDFLQEDTQKSLHESFQLCEKWHQNTELLDYIFSPRFAPVCSPKLMQEVGNYAQKNNIFIQTHLSENTGEIKWVRELFPAAASYTDVYAQHNLLYENTILGHVIHISEAELDIIKNYNSKIAHCPDSNFFLKSGTFPYQRILEKNIKFALASDVGAGSSLSMLNVMKMSNYRQEKYIVSPAEALYYATLGAADIIGKKDIIGSIKAGKQADLTFFSTKNLQDKQEMLSELLYLSSDKLATETIIAGKTVHKKSPAN